MSDLPDFYLRYMAQRDADRANAVAAFLGRLTDRERALMRDAAVMGYVQGRRHPADEPHPKDGAVLDLVVDACLHFTDLYPGVAYAAAPAPEEPRP